ncbi:endoplasmic reticulum lectin 1 [Schistosoma bovis]|uniref:Endoplasmic reticulum lectin 1 n=1 Tax=Schistosoma bovis TaxID=6184 RepID=A0A430Q766_SCHBO|nr:endoplasmic reticulum lectin 1 [Schistosoma bovis]
MQMTCIMCQIKRLSSALAFLCFSCVIASYNVTDDIIFDFKWLGDSKQPREKSDVVKIRTTIGEDYECFIPMLFHNTEEDEAKNTDSVDEETLLQPLFTEQPCNKIESSRPRILPGTLLSKYVLTLHDINCLDPKMGKDRPSKDNPPSTVTLGEHSYPYYGINYIDGTLCDLNQEHRTATVMYICHESVTGQIVDVSEIRTCQYQVVFATKFLCSNPLYKQKRAHTNPISCHSKNSSPSKPSALVALEAERKKFQSRSFTDLAALLSNAFKSKVKISAKHGKDVLFYQVNPAEDPDDESTSQVDNTKTNVNDDAKNSHDSSSFSDLDVVNQVSSSLKTPSSTLPKINPSIMKSVNDNQDANTKKLQEIRLGHWDLDAHLKWFEENNVESSVFCDLIPLADENDILPLDKV